MLPELSNGTKFIDMIFGKGFAYLLSSGATTLEKRKLKNTRLYITKITHTKTESTPLRTLNRASNSEKFSCNVHFFEVCESGKILDRCGALRGFKKSVSSCYFCLQSSCHLFAFRKVKITAKKRQSRRFFDKREK